MTILCDTPSRDDTYLDQVSLGYHERIRSYDPDKQKHCFNLDLGDEVVKSVHDTTSSGDADGSEVLFNYLEQVRCYGPDKRKFTYRYVWRRYHNIYCL